MTFHIITLFPKAFGSYLGESILKRAIEEKDKGEILQPARFCAPEPSEARF